MRCDSFDLYQMHAVTDLDELDARAGAVAAILAARDEGLCRFVGITGHNLTTPGAQLEALRRYDLDTVMFPVEPAPVGRPAYRHDAEALLAEAERTRRGGDGHQGRGGAAVGRAAPQHRATWYEAYTSDDEIDRGVRFVLSVPGVDRPVHAERPRAHPGHRRRRRAASSPWTTTSARRDARHGGGGAHLPHADRMILVPTGRRPVRARRAGVEPHAHHRST